MMPSLKPAQLERRKLNRRRCRKAAAQLAAEKTKEEKLQDEAAKRRAAAKAFSERTRRQHNAKLRKRRGPPKGIKKKIDEERGEQLHAAVTLLEDSARLANRAREILGAAPSHEEGAPSEAAFAAAVAAAKAGAALGIARQYCWSVAMAGFAARRQQRLVKIQAWKARRGRVAQVPADTEAEVAASASAPVGDAAGDDGAVDSDGDCAAAAVAAASNGDIAAPFVVTDPASPGAGAGDGDTGATTADTEAEVAASASAPVGDAAGDDDAVDSDGDCAAAAVAAASNGDIAAPFVVTDPASPGAGDGDTGATTADTEAEVAASASAPVGDAAGDDGAVDSDGDCAAAAVAAASNGDIAAPFAVTDPASPGAGDGAAPTANAAAAVDIFPTYREIRNRGHDCWVIAAIQMLRRMDDTHRALVGATPTPCGEGKLLTTALVKAFRSLDKAGKDPVAVQPFLDVFFGIFPQFVDGQMDDASMALGAILDRLHDENTSATPTPTPTPPSPSPSPLPSIASPARMRVSQTRKCHVCKLECHSVVDQSILHINIPEEGGDVKPRDPSGWTLQELVENAMRPQESIDDRCQNCMDEKELQKAISASLEGPGGTRHEEEKIPQPDEEEQDQRLTISTRILHLPRYLCFSVVRFTPSIGNDSGFEKSNVAIDATKTLSLGDAFGDTAHASAKAELISVVSHHGRSCRTGHWTTTWSMPGQCVTLGGLPKGKHTPAKKRRQPAKQRRQQAKQRSQQATLFLYRTSGQL